MPKKSDIVGVSPDDPRIEARKEKLKIDTDNTLTSTEYDQLTQILLWLDDYDDYVVKAGGPGKIDPDLEQQARMYRTLIVQHIGKARPTKKKEADFLTRVKTELATLENSGLLPDNIPWTNAEKESLLSKLRDAEVKKDEQTKSM